MMKLPLTTLALSTMSLLASPQPIDLTGTWNLRLDNKDEMIQSPPSSWKFTDTMKLPSTTDLEKKGPHVTEPQPFNYHLNREWDFKGPAYYSREITIPTDWKNVSTQLFLERVMWQSRVWVDSKEITQPQDSLNTPHIHHLGKLSPGKHQLILRIDNRMIHPIGDKGHAYGQQTQSTWNGVVGKLELRAEPTHHISNVRIFPKNDGSVDIEVIGKFNGHLTATIAKTSASTQANGTQTNLSLKIPNPILWSEFAPKIYTATIQLSQAGKTIDTFTSTFGFREVKHDGNQLILNNKPAFMRGNLECAVFPKLGHPPVTVDAWKKIWKVYKNYGLNHARFHSWCPPEAAFTAADELGIYLQVEAPIWIDHWMTKPNKRKEMDTEGYPKGLGVNDRSIDSFAQSEIRRTLDTYGNHPSFIFFCIGNELGPSDFNVTKLWIQKAKLHDPRHLYAASTARTITEFCDFNATHNIPGIGWTRQHYEFSSNWDYEKQYARASVPIIAHEIGQWPVYVDWKSELPKYTGPLKPYRLEKMAEEAKKNGLYDRSAELKRASGATNRILYRDEIESFLRTPSCRGFQLLGMQDFSGQGEALIGWLDSFYESKGTTDPATFRQYCAPTVPLLKLPKYIFTTDETPTIHALLHHYGKNNFDEQPVEWSLTTRLNKGIDSGKLSHTNAKSGTVTALGTFSLKFTKITSPTQVQLTIKLSNTQITNTYNLWVYPNELKPTNPTHVVVTSDWETTAKPALKQGKSVVLIANYLGGPRAAKLAAWMPLYWSVPFFPGQNRKTIGLRVSADHPALAQFPTPPFADWNWYRLCKKAHGFDITDLTPNSYRPIAEPVSDFHYNRRLASIFEAQVGQGKLLVCGYDISDQQVKKLPEVAQLRRSLTTYASSSKFNPQTTINTVAFDQLFHDPSLKLQKLPQKFTHADLYVNAAGKVRTFGKNAPWRKGSDQVLRQVKGVTYTVKPDGLWRDKSGSAWHGKSIHLTITPRAGVPGKFYIRFSDWNKNNRTGTVTFEGQTQKLGPHTQGKWLTFNVIREHTNDGQLILTAKSLTGPNLMVTDIAFVPDEE